MQYKFHVGVVRPSSKMEYKKLNSPDIVIISMILITRSLLISIVIVSNILWFSHHPTLADPLDNSLRQRIGDYDIQISTLPTAPISGKETSIKIMITSVSNLPVTDTPIIIRVSDENNELIRTHPILLSGGHYSYNYNFNKSGIFLFSIEVLDDLASRNSIDSSNELIFDFPIRVSEPYLAEIVKMTLPLTVTIVAIISVISWLMIAKFKKSKKMT